MSGPLRIGLVGGTSVEAEGLPLILPRSSFQLCCSVDSIDELDEQVAGGSLDVILIEHELDQTGWRQLSQLCSRFPETRLCLISDEFDLAVVVRAIRTNVNGFISASISAEGLVESLKLIAMGEILLPSQIAKNLPPSLCDLDTGQDDARASAPVLSGREMEVMRYLAMGCPNKVIARQLDITMGQTKVHLNAVLRKLSASNRTQAAICAISRGILPPRSDLTVLSAQPSALDVRLPLTAS